MSLNKIVFFGEANTGKTQLLKRILNIPFNSEYKPTKAPDFDILKIDDETMQLWDTKGESGGISYIANAFNRGAILGVFCVDLKKLMDNPDKKIDDEILQSFHNQNPGKKIILIGTKADLLADTLNEQQRKAEQLLARIPGTFCTRLATSAKDNTNISELEILLEKYTKEANDKLLQARDLLPCTCPLYEAIHNLYEQAKDLPPQKYQAIQEETLKLVKTLLKDEYMDKTAVIQQFADECSLHLEGEYPHVIKALLAVAATALVTLVAGALGFAIGFALGLWSGPGAFITGLIAGEAAAVSVATLSSTLGVGVGIYTFFKGSKESSVMAQVNNVAEKALSFDPNTTSAVF
ncbi:GTP-binding protein [Legionella cardiaca]|uniref:GTP-binding protein n=1 Tax=Legionella cardiaca TaxID=1071983 RepID=A0ABY8ANG7_9GAMM|nr:GTP-binding protein [Legionella cardiaca]WED42073.1 GTP-binding protein [Legionella cardiaca]